MKNRPKKILVCGNYGASNLGDDAILAGILKLLESAFPGAKVSVMTSDRLNTKKFFGTEAVSFFPAGIRSALKFWMFGEFWLTFKTLWQTDLVILGGGGLFNDERPKAIWIWLIQSFWFYLFGKKVVCLAQSVGPLKSRFGKWATKWVYKKAVLKTVRDEKSLGILKSIGIGGALQLADPAFALAYELESRHKINNEVVISLREWDSEKDISRYKLLGELANYLNNKHNLKAVFVPFQQRHDETDLYCYEFIKDQVGLKKVSDYKQAMEIIARSKIVIAMRLHAIIMAVLARRPFVAISYSKKVNDFVETLGLEQFSLEYQDLNLEQLKEKVDQVLAEEKQVEATLEKQKMKMVYEFYKHEKLLKDIYKTIL